MAFTIQNWGRASVSANEPLVTLTSGTIVGSPSTYEYWTLDTQNTVATTANYFATVITDLSVGDRISVYSSTDGTVVSYLVTVVTLPGTVTIAVTSATLVAQGVLTPAVFGTGFTAGIILIPAPGANRIAVLTNATLSLVWVTTQYTLGGAVRFQYGVAGGAGGTNAMGTTVAAADINAAVANSSQLLLGVAQAWNANTLANLAISLGVATQNFATGDSPIRYSIQYRIATLA